MFMEDQSLGVDISLDLKIYIKRSSLEFLILQVSGQREIIAVI